MDLKFNNNIPIYLQLVEQLKIKIISGKIKEGERLPSVRDFSLEMKVNPNTMQKALMELENLKLIYTERTNGKFVTKDKKVITKYRKEYATELSKKYFYNMEDIGYDIKTIIEFIEKIGGDK